METEKVTAVASAEQAAPIRFEKERGQFRALLLTNPNYFGNLKVSQFPPVLSVKNDTTYEELCSVGFQPQLNQLEAVVHVKQPTGYGGGICSNGTPEYVRFYVSYDGGATWHDLGIASFTAYNIPEGTTGSRRLEYAVTMPFDPRRQRCRFPNLAQVRAILSWNDPPPANTPDHDPVWGNVHDTHIQIEPYRGQINWADILATAKIPKEFLDDIDLAQPLKAVEPKTLNVAELQALYRNKGVEPHRFALPELHKLINQPSSAASLMDVASPGVLQGLGIDLSDIIGSLFPTDGNTRYEELECIGLDPNLDLLTGVIRVKLPSGYSGGLCTNGSREYVTFWADFNNNGTFETCLGTTSVTVYDIADMPKEGLEYAVFLPVNLTQYRQPCEEGPRVVRIRAIMSWQVAPPCGNPNYVPVWGNREETLIHIKPGPSVPPGTHMPFIETVGSMHVADIDMTTGLASGPAALAGFTANDSPFGGEVILTGHIAYPPDISNGATTLKYRVWVWKVGDPPQRLNNAFTIGRSQLLNGVWSTLSDVTQSTDINDFYEYREDLTDGFGNPMIFVVGNVLARWQTGGQNGLWRIQIEVDNSAGPNWFSNVVTVKLDNTAAVPSIAITSGGGNCADFTVGDVIEGTYSVTDEHFGSLSLSVSPGLGGTFTAPAPLPRAYPIVPTTGEAGTWKLDTTGMPRCGYVIVLGARDRTIVNSGSVGFYSQDVVGLCLRGGE